MLLLKSLKRKIYYVSQIFFDIISVMTDYVTTLTAKFCARPSGEVYCIFPFHTLLTWTLGERQRLEIHDPGRESEA